MKEYKDFLVDDDLVIYNKFTGSPIKSFIGTDGYMMVKLNCSQSHMCERVHVIYAHCFIPNPNNYRYVNHIDSDKTNNSLDNLEWCTNSYNVAHGWHSGNRVHHNHTHVKVIDTLEKKEYEFTSLRKCSEELHVDRHKVARILKGELRNDYMSRYIFSYV